MCVSDISLGILYALLGMIFGVVIVFVCAPNTRERKKKSARGKGKQEPLKDNFEKGWRYEAPKDGNRRPYYPPEDHMPRSAPVTGDLEMERIDSEARRPYRRKSRRSKSERSRRPCLPRSNDCSAGRYRSRSSGSSRRSRSEKSRSSRRSRSSKRHRDTSKSWRSRSRMARRLEQMRKSESERRNERHERRRKARDESDFDTLVEEPTQSSTRSERSSRSHSSKDRHRNYRSKRSQREGDWLHSLRSRLRGKIFKRSTGQSDLRDDFNMESATNLEPSPRKDPMGTRRERERRGREKLTMALNALMARNGYLASEGSDEEERTSRNQTQHSKRDHSRRSHSDSSKTIGSRSSSRLKKMRSSRSHRKIRSEEHNRKSMISNEGRPLQNSGRNVKEKVSDAASSGSVRRRHLQYTGEERVHSSSRSFKKKSSHSKSQKSAKHKRNRHSGKESTSRRSARRGRSRSERRHGDGAQKNASFMMPVGEDGTNFSSKRSKKKSTRKKSRKSVKHTKKHHSNDKRSASRRSIKQKRPHSKRKVKNDTRQDALPLFPLEEDRADSSTETSKKKPSRDTSGKSAKRKRKHRSSKISGSRKLVKQKQSQSRRELKEETQRDASSVIPLKVDKSGSLREVSKDEPSRDTSRKSAKRKRKHRSSKISGSRKLAKQKQSRSKRGLKDDERKSAAFASFMESGTTLEKSKEKSTHKKSKRSAEGRTKYDLNKTTTSKGYTKAKSSRSKRQIKNDTEKQAMLITPVNEKTTDQASSSEKKSFLNKAAKPRIEERKQDLNKENKGTLRDTSEKSTKERFHRPKKRSKGKNIESSKEKRPSQEFIEGPKQVSEKAERKLDSRKPKGNNSEMGSSSRSQKVTGYKNTKLLKTEADRKKRRKGKSEDFGNRQEVSVKERGSFQSKSESKKEKGKVSRRMPTKRDEKDLAKTNSKAAASIAEKNSLEYKNERISSIMNNESLIMNPPKADSVQGTTEIHKDIQKKLTANVDGELRLGQKCSIGGTAHSAEKRPSGKPSLMSSADQQSVADVSKAQMVTKAETAEESKRGRCSAQAVEKCSAMDKLEFGKSERSHRTRISGKEREYGERKKSKRETPSRNLISSIKPKPHNGNSSDESSTHSTQSSSRRHRSESLKKPHCRGNQNLEELRRNLASSLSNQQKREKEGFDSLAVKNNQPLLHVEYFSGVKPTAPKKRRKHQKNSISDSVSSSKKRNKFHKHRSRKHSLSSKSSSRKQLPSERSRSSASDLEGNIDTGKNSSERIKQSSKKKNAKKTKRKSKEQRVLEDNTQNTVVQEKMEVVMGDVSKESAIKFRSKDNKKRKKKKVSKSRKKQKEVKNKTIQEATSDQLKHTKLEEIKSK